MKESFDTIKTANDSLKKQVTSTVMYYTEKEGIVQVFILSLGR